MIQKKKTNFYAGNEEFYYKYNFAGEVLETGHIQHPKNKFGGYVEKIVSLYDHRGRLMSIDHYIDSCTGGVCPSDGLISPDAAVRIADYEYDELGKLIQKKMFPNMPVDSLRTLNYGYHIQGMLEKTQSPLFNETLIYGAKNTNILANLANFVPSYNGNISAKQTKVLLTPNDNILTTMAECYKYDPLDRLTDAFHSGNSGANFSVRNISYDLQGNVLTLTRYGITEKPVDQPIKTGIVNQLEFSKTNERHQPEEVSNIVDQWPTYGSQTYLPAGTFANNTFDRNGNTVFDDARETSFSYNHLNLTTKISNPSDTMQIQYDALGNKVRQISGNDTLYFVGETIYLCNAQSAMCKVKYLSLPEGYLSYDSINIAHSTLHFAQYHAVIHDYLGSVRMVIDVDSNKVKEVNHYDPTGVEYGLSSNPFGVQLYKHQGMERLNVSGFSLHYHFARNADNLYGRWLTRDKLEEQDYWNGAYVYCRNNPKYIDEDGKWPRQANDNPMGKSFEPLHQKSSSANKISQTVTVKEEWDVVSKNSLFTLSANVSKIFGEAKTTNLNIIKTFTPSETLSSTSAEFQVKTSDAGIATNADITTKDGSATAGASVFIGPLQIGISQTDSPDVIHSSINLNVDVQTSENTSVGFSIGIKPLGVAAIVVPIVFPEIPTCATSRTC